MSQTQDNKRARIKLRNFLLDQLRDNVDEIKITAEDARLIIKLDRWLQTCEKKTLIINDAQLIIRLDRWLQACEKENSDKL